jgi:F0F1-type ATP synthase assembly protein I
MFEKRKKQDSGSSTIVALSLVFELGYMIAIPAVGFSFGGRYLDMYFGTSPLFLLVGIVSALILSSFMVYKKIQHI